jgi:hypothetical protein
MKKKILALGSTGILFSLLLIGLTGNAAAAAPDCDRACLEGFVNQYLAAVVAHDPSRLPLAKSVRYTENGVTMKLGDGMWGVADGLGDYKLYYADPQGGQVGFMGVVSEHGHPQILSLRLKLEKREISEIETIVARSGAGAKPPAALVDKPIFHQALATSERRPRAEMIKIANSYFEALVQAKGGIAPFDANCTRVENGNITSNNPSPTASAMMKLSCGEQIEQEFSKFFTRIRDRRFPIVDEERGLVYTVIYFDHDGRMTSVKLKEGSVLGPTLTVRAPFDTPYSFMIGELFKIKDGKIYQVEAVLLTVPYSTASAWKTN